jgi:hypothetical protein
MGSAPQIPSYSAPAGAPSFTPSAGIGADQYISALQNQTPSPGSSSMSGVLNASGLGAAGAAGVNTPEGQAIMANQLNYAMSDADFAARYPQMIQAQQQYQGYLTNLLGTQTPQSIAAGNSLSNAGQGMLTSGSNIVGQGQNLAGTGQGIIGQGQNIAGWGQGIIGTGQNIIGAGQNLAGQSGQFLAPAATLAAGAQGVGQPDITLGQNLISGNQAIDPVVQQELMRSGLSSAASALGGAAGLGGEAGQAAVGRNLGVGAENWVNTQRQQGQALQQTGMGLTTGQAGAAATLAGAGTNVANAGTGMIGAGSGVIGAGTGVINAGSGMIGAGTGVTNAGTSMIGAGTGLESAGSNAMQGGQGIINSAAQNANASFGLASSMFQPRSFGLQGSDAANISLSNTAGLNNMMQYLYSTKVQGAQYNTQIAAQNASAQAQSSGNMISGGAGAASAVAVGVAFAMSCHVARKVYGANNPEWRLFRLWLYFNAPGWLKGLYLRYSETFANREDVDPEVIANIREFMDEVLERNRNVIRFRYGVRCANLPSLPLAA